MNYALYVRGKKGDECGCREVHSVMRIIGNETGDEMGTSHGRSCRPFKDLDFYSERNWEPLRGSEQQSNLTHLTYL